MKNNTDNENKNKNKNINENEAEKISGGKKTCDSIFIKNLNTTPLLAYGGPNFRPQSLRYGGIRPKKIAEDIENLISDDKNKKK